MYVAKRLNQRFCSNECQSEWQKTNTGINNPKFEGKVVKCEYCKNDIAVGKYKYNHSNYHFCSSKCRQNWYAEVWSQSPEWKEISRYRAIKMLEDGKIDTQTAPQVKINNVLSSLNVEYINEKAYDFFVVDNYLVEQNLIIEVMGDYWHTTPIKYGFPENKSRKNTISRDKAKHTFIKHKYGIEILYLWENDIMKETDKCEKLILEYIKNNGKLKNYHSFNYEYKDGRLQLSKNIIIPYQDMAVAA